MKESDVDQTLKEVKLNRRKEETQKCGFELFPLNLISYFMRIPGSSYKRDLVTRTFLLFFACWTKEFYSISIMMKKSCVKQSFSLKTNKLKNVFVY